MYKIPTIEEKIDRRRPTQLEATTPTGFVRLQPSVYTVPQYPLTTLYGYPVVLYDAFTTKPSAYNLRAVKNATDDVFLGARGSIGGLGVNTYTRRLNTLYALLPPSCTSLLLDFVVFTSLNGLTTDISAYMGQGCVLEQVNITGHIATFSSTVREFTLDSMLLTKVEFPVPAALRFTRVMDLSSYTTKYTVYDIPSAVGSVDYVLYNDTMYNRARTTIPTARSFTSRTGGGLLWI